MSTKKREQTITKAVKAMDKAAEALMDLELMIFEIDSRINTDVEEKFREGLRERARYWENCTWWKQK